MFHWQCVSVYHSFYRKCKWSFYTYPTCVRFVPVTNMKVLCSRFESKQKILNLLPTIFMQWTSIYRNSPHQAAYTYIYFLNMNIILYVFLCSIGCIIHFLETVQILMNWFQLSQQCCTKKCIQIHMRFPQTKVSIKSEHFGWHEAAHNIDNSFRSGKMGNGSWPAPEAHYF